MYQKGQVITESILTEIRNERMRQQKKHGDQNHLPSGTGPDGNLFGELLEAAGNEGVLDNERISELAKARCKAASENEGGDGSITFEHILTEEFFEAICEDDPERLYGELVQVAAVVVQWLEKLYKEEEEQER